MTNLVASGIHKSFGAQPVLVGLDLSVGEGEVAAIVGASGSGKTTLLRVAAGFERADAGTISLGELVVDGDRFVPPEQRGIGYVPQEGALFPHLNVRRNVAFGLRRSERSGRVDELLELVGLSGLDRRYPHQLSGGQQQRVALARAMAIRPRVVLLDEPFSSLDAGLRASVRADVGRVLREAGTTTILVTHDQDEALSFADVVGVLRDGRIVQMDTPARIYRQPADIGVAGFVGQANLVPGVMEGAWARTALGPVEVDDPPDDAGAVTVLVRPEQLQLTAEPGSGPPPADPPGAIARGVVVHEEFYGHDAVVRIALVSQVAPASAAVPEAAAGAAPAGAEARAEVGVGAGQGDGPAGALEVVARTAGGDPPPVGSRVWLRVAGSARAFPARD